MRSIYLFAVIVLASLTVFGSEVKTFTLFDGETVDGKLSLPAGAAKLK